MLRTRIITAVIGIPLLLGALYLGGIAWAIVFGLMGLLALYEYLNMMKISGFTPFTIAPYGILFVLLFREVFANNWLPLLFGFILIMLADLVLRYPKRNLNDLTISFFGAFYIGFLLSYALALQNLAMNNTFQAFLYIVLVFILTWSSDIGGYVFGRLWGQSKLTPQLSPNKTWAGALGGVGLTIVLALTSHYIIPIENLTLQHLLWLGLAGSLTAQFGDLFASAMKRFFAVKDSGNIIPGHGGVLDRFDSFLLVLPVLYYLLSYMI